MAYQPTTGHAVGVIMQEDDILRPPGDVGNATTFPFPVLYELVQVPPAVLKAHEEAIQPRYVERVVQAARQLASRGVRCITGGCGFMAAYQPVVRQAVDVPVLMSSLLQIPLVAAVIGPEGHIGIITANRGALTTPYLRAVGIDAELESRCVVAGLEEIGGLGLRDSAAGTPQAMTERGRLLVEVARELVKRRSDVCAVVLECTNLPPFAAAIQDALQLPVFDITTLVRWAEMAVVRRMFRGFA